MYTFGKNILYTIIERERILVMMLRLRQADANTHYRNTFMVLGYGEITV
ncbi:MAG: hypothetical protein ACYDG2_13895 [Ruminiclostridium sp.]